MMIRWGHEWKAQLPDMGKEPVPIFVEAAFRKHLRIKDTIGGFTQVTYALGHGTHHSSQTSQTAWLWGPLGLTGHPVTATMETLRRTKTLGGHLGTLKPALGH